MSRIGKKPVFLPAGVSVQTADGLLKVKGPKGEIARRIASGISISQQGNLVNVIRESDSNRDRAAHGLMRSLLSNMVTGVKDGYEKKLEIQGVGYKAEVKGKALVLSLGFSHPVEYPFPDGISIEVDKGTFLTVRGPDRERVGQVAAELHAVRPPDSYKGKGVRHQGERVRIKAGKTAQ